MTAPISSFGKCAGCGHRGIVWHTGARLLCRGCWHEAFGREETK